MNELPKRKRNRLTDYDYSQNGVYHITICTEHYKKILSENNIRRCRGDYQSPAKTQQTVIQRNACYAFPTLFF